jgi:hypothetical protein
MLVIVVVTSAMMIRYHWDCSYISEAKLGQLRVDILDDALDRALHRLPAFREKAIEFASKTADTSGMTDEEAAAAQEKMKTRGKADTERWGDKVKALKACIRYTKK